MNETIQTLLNRRSVRKYKAEQIKDEELNVVLEAGKFAPSGGNQQSALFVVIQETKESIKKFSGKYDSGKKYEILDPLIRSQCSDEHF